ncbi:hypothetical protein [uncultured Sulfitobacter sp.]|uniref:hypothetical protein n=1 Tax=uncultured Sulfitobacter sp. TaxID=191468 RepID=UPI00262A2590|nr:hypothetical protein [uncultured Sulfitobacter sp.]
MTDTPDDPTPQPAFDPDEVLAVARSSAGRRLLGLGSLGLLGILLIYIAIVESPSLIFRLVLLIMGVGALLLVDKMRRATASTIELTPTALRDSDGTVIALIEDVDGLDRGFFAFKPSNGFLLRTVNKGPNEWRPGMWWRVGRRIGVGGMTPAHHSKQMSEILAIMMAQRDLTKGK